MRQYSKLFSPITIGGMELDNRFVVPPMCTNLGEGDGFVSQKLIDYWEARAKGGWGLLIVEITAVHPLGRVNQELGLWDDKFVPGFRKLAEVAHRYGTRIIVQLHHPGRQSSSEITGSLVAPSPIACPRWGEIPRELSTGEVYELIEKYGDAALRAQEAGIDGVEVHGAHGYLVAEFMSAWSNKRTDEFGGSFENRMRFPTEIIKSIRSKVGRFPIAFRFSGEEEVPGGRTIEESCMVARTIEEAGVDLMDVSVGVAANDMRIIAPAAIPPGHLLPVAAKIKKSVSVPLIAVGRINEPALAEDAIATGKADLIAWGRASIADPDLPNKVASGRYDEICPCIACLEGCGPFSPNRRCGTISCLVNPFAGREGEMKTEPAAKSRKIVVVGGGPGGLEAAWLAAARGHQVILYEKEPVLGGQFRAAAIPPFKQDIARAIAYYIRMGEKYGVEFKTGVNADIGEILAEKPDVVVVATGGEPLIPEMKGAEGPRVATAVDIIEGRHKAGNKVLIIGGNRLGCETADLLGEHHHDVTIVKRRPEVAPDVYPAVRSLLLQRLKEYRVLIETGITVKEFIEDGIVAERDGRETRFTGYDTIVLAMGAKPVNVLGKKLEDKVPELYVIGDALAPRMAINAIEEAACTAAKL